MKNITEMSTTQQETLFHRMGYHFAMGVISAVFTIIMAAGFCIFLLTYFEVFTDDTDTTKWDNSGMSLHTDAKTGLQYLGNGNALIPRIDRDGKHMVKGH